MHMKTGVEQSVYAIFLLSLLPDRAVLPGEAISQQLGASASYFQKLLRKLVSADLITSVPGVKGGFKLKKKLEDIRIYDVYLAIEGQQTLYSSSGTLNDMLELQEEDQCCLLTDLMQEAETAWKLVLKKATLDDLAMEMQEERFKNRLECLQAWVQEKMVI
ncbi:RrF2 family transcriptional regulator [Paenibacillus bouchesdurhonensis]|uniref:RrF2 family transcriptional regulator n=1 Tax=Paenibacillus bouchesdurhonensis TaxID=1870990 RepID=UPI000DA5F7A6|nr:Rrf2 family transcriptional regulator [Paenibacillus bouchesdurhonensis]